MVITLFYYPDLVNTQPRECFHRYSFIWSYSNNNVWIHVSHLPVTLTWKEHEAVFPLLSMVSQITMVCPLVKLVPDSGSHVTETFREFSEVNGSSHLTTAVDFPSSVSINWSLTQISVGALLSIIQNMSKCLFVCYTICSRTGTHFQRERPRFWLVYSHVAWKKFSLLSVVFRSFKSLLLVA